MDKVFEFLRFLNLLEPGDRVLSISKVMMWATTAAVIITIIRGGDLESILAASVPQLIAIGNYAHRRQVNVTRRNEYLEDEVPDQPSA